MESKHERGKTDEGSKNPETDTESEFWVSQEGKLEKWKCWGSREDVRRGKWEEMKGRGMTVDNSVNTSSGKTRDMNDWVCMCACIYVTFMFVYVCTRVRYYIF